MKYSITSKDLIEIGRFKLNVDGTRNGEGLIGAGGVIRDSNGVWSKGFMKNIGRGEVLQAEAWGLFTGLQMAVEMDIKHLEVETDSAVLFNLLHSTDIELHPLGTLLNNCKTLAQHFESYSIKHIYRERNTVADILARRSLDQDLGTYSFSTNPAFTTQAVLDDIDGLVMSRSFVTALAV